MDPSEQSPFRRCDFKKTNRQKEKKRRNTDECGNPNPSLPAVCDRRIFRCIIFPALIERRYRWPILPAKPKKIESKERHKPPVVVLLVDRPFAAELPAHGEPERTE